MAGSWLRQLRHRHCSVRNKQNATVRTALAADAGAGIEVVGVTSLQLSEGGRQFSVAELEHATQGFSSQLVLGEGGFGKVYKGTLCDGRAVAIKKLDRSGLAGDSQFELEINLLNMMQHPNIVSLLGVCTEGTERMAVLEFASKGSVRDLLDDQLSPLSWPQRVQIAVGAAWGLRYLHDYFDPPFIHRDFKTSNILVTEHGKALVADFNLVRRMSRGVNEDNMTAPESTQVVGTFGYIGPEYFQTGRLNEKSDVWAYGVVLLELLTGAPVIDTQRQTNCIHLVQWCRRADDASDVSAIREILDPAILNAPDNELAALNELAVACCNQNFWARPTMKQVVERLDAVCSHYQGAPPVVKDTGAGSASYSPVDHRGGHKKDAVVRPKLRLDAMVIPPSAAQSATASGGLPPGGVQLSPRRAGFAAPPAAAYASPRREPEPLGWAASPLTVMGHPVRRAQFQQATIGRRLQPVPTPVVPAAPKVLSAEEEDLAQQAASIAYIQELSMHSDVITSTSEWHSAQAANRRVHASR